MNEVAPHFRRAAQLRATLERSGLGRVNFEVMVNRMPAPAALFGSAGELLHQNEAVQATLANASAKNCPFHAAHEFFSRPDTGARRADRRS